MILLAIEGILIKVKLRIVTFKETFKLIKININKEWFAAIIYIFINLGFRFTGFRFILAI